MLGSGTGVGSFQLGGSMIASSCDKGQNASGCLTFQFKTNGNNQKGTGWDAWVECRGSTTTISAGGNQFYTINCNNLKADVSIKAARINAGCSLPNDSILVEVVNAKGALCKDTCIRADSSFILTNLAIGNYTVRHKVKSMPSLQAQHRVIVSPSALTCNDKVEMALGGGCSAVIRPDHVLENPCDTSENLYYDIAIKTLDGKVIKTGTSRNGAYPMITKSDIEICKGVEYQVEISRVYDYKGTCCSEGLLKDICWTRISFVDGTKPWFTSSRTDSIIACEVDLDKFIANLKKPTVIDDCDSVKLGISNRQLLSGNSCSDVRTYIITWEATDLCGKKAHQTDTLRVFRPKSKDFIKLPDVVLSCGEDTDEALNDYDKLGTIKIPIPGDTLVLNTEEYVCNYILLKEDEVIPHPGGKKVVRYWSIVDGCSSKPVPTTIDTQLIEFIDTLAPVLECSDYQTIETARVIDLPPFECTMNVTLPKPDVTDLCIEPKVEMFRIEQLKEGIWVNLGKNLSEAGALSCDTFRVGWQAIDRKVENPKRDTCFEYFRLADVTAPQIICADEIQIAYDKEGTRIYAADVENQNRDACGVVDLEIRREGGVWSKYLDFVCTDVHKTIRAELKVLDKNGNYNTCSFNIVLQDFIPPFCADLPDFEGTCDNFKNDQLGPTTDTNGDLHFSDAEWRPLTGDLLDEYNNSFGDPKCEDNLACVDFSQEQEYQVIYSKCGEIEARRRYRIIDWNGAGLASNWQEQKITISYKSAWSFTVPVDFFGGCGDSIPAAGIKISNEACDLVAWEHKDQVFEVVQDACFKVIRTYYIINWCNYEQGQEPVELNREENVIGLVTNEKTITAANYPDQGYFTYTQVLKVTDQETPTLTINDVETCIYGVGDIAPLGVEDQTPGAAPYECDTLKVFSAQAQGCASNIYKSYSFSYEIYADGVLEGSGKDSVFAWAVRPRVDYKVKFTAYDHCGNSVAEEKHYRFEDCTKPTVFCGLGSIIEIATEGTARLDAVVLDKNSYDNCTPANQLRYRIWHNSLSVPRPNTKAGASALPSIIHFDCNYRDTQLVYFYVLDQDDNFDFCITRVIVRNSANTCPADMVGQSLIGGNIQTMEGEMVEAVEVRVNGSTTVPTAMQTSADGHFSYSLQRGNTYEVAPRRIDQPLNGVSTFDLIVISKHILGKEKFDSPYKYIAADINKSGSVTAFDLVQLRQLILNIESDFPNNESWRFVDAQYEFTSDNPLTEPFKERIEVNNHQNNKMDADFVAIKIGDLNHSATANLLHRATESRTSKEAITFKIEDRQVRSGEYFTIDFTSADASVLEGYQFALAFKNLELIGVEEGLAKAHHFGQTMIEKGVLTTSWNRSADFSQATKTYFSLEFKAKQGGRLSELIRLKPSILETEAYHLTGELLEIELQFEERNSIFKLEQNRPNPFSRSTKIGFQLPKEGKATLTILDLQGRVLQQQEKYFLKGYHEWTIEGQTLTSEGILYYQLATDEAVLTKKMMFIE
jgi:hypothetical protein